MARRLLLDSHTFLWFVTDDRRLSSATKILIEDSSNEILFSPASVWELSIKCRLGRRILKPNPVEFFESQAQTNGFTLLPIELRHLVPISTMPMHHGEPFDRLLIAQTIVERVSLISGDVIFDAYEGLQRLW